MNKMMNGVVSMPFDVKKFNSVLNPNKIAFSKSEAKVHDFVVSNPLQVVYESLSSIAHKVNVGEATIVRYFKKLGYSNFTNFRVAVYKNYENLHVSNDIPFIDNIISNMTETINNTKTIIDMNKIEEASTYMLQAKYVLIAGMGISHTSALDMFTKCLRIGLPAVVIDDSHFNYMFMAVAKSSATVALLYSFSGETAEIINIAKRCKEKNIKIIAISNYLNSTLHQYADVFLQTKGFENDINGGFFSSKISQLFVSDVLITNCALKDEKKTHMYNQLVTNSVIK